MPRFAAGEGYILQMNQAKVRPFKRWLERRIKPEPPVNTIVVPALTVVVEPTTIIVPPAEVVVSLPRPDQPRAMVWSNCVMALASIAMLVVACATLVVSKDQWQAMEKQNAQTEAMLDQMRLEQRAWVSIRQPRFIVYGLACPQG